MSVTCLISELIPQTLQVATIQFLGREPVRTVGYDLEVWDG